MVLYRSSRNVRTRSTIIIVGIIFYIVSVCTLYAYPNIFPTLYSMEFFNSCFVLSYLFGGFTLFLERRLEYHNGSHSVS